MRIRLFVLALGLFLLQGCAGLDSLGALGQLVQPPRFEQVPDRPAEIRLQGLTGAGIRLWTKVSNPNPFSLRLGTLRGTLHIEESKAADVDFPLGLPLRSGEATSIPIDLSVSFSDLPGLANAVRRAASRQPLAYHLQGTIGVDAGQLGQPTFGPMTIMRGQLRGIQ